MEAKDTSLVEKLLKARKEGRKEERERILQMIWVVDSGVGKGSGRISKVNLRALQDKEKDG